MAKKNFAQQSKEKVTFGKLIFNLRVSKSLSLRKLAKAIGLPASNLSYIENGINFPTAEIYDKIINTLQPEKGVREKLDNLYGKIRKVPPPDICEILLSNPTLYKKIRLSKNL
ncbi:MAG: helix-turn-helix transcriptional regulator [Clostridia bacterium]|nr:helix-turn-helix transcriptional regulator [Clostridia bacterium]